MLQVPIIRTHDQLRSKVRAWRAFGERVALAPVETPIHPGMLNLIQIARGKAERVIASITPPEPYEDEDGTEPVEEMRDCLLLEREGADLIFAPTFRQVYPLGLRTSISAAELTNVMDGAVEPGSVNRRALAIVKQLFQCQADVAVFSELDWQLVSALRVIVADLDIPTKIVSVPAIRDASGMASFADAEELSPEQLTSAARLRSLLTNAAEEIADGAPVDETLSQAIQKLTGAGADAVHYVEYRDAKTLEALEAADPDRPSRIFGSISIGDIRIADNAPVA